MRRTPKTQPDLPPEPIFRTRDGEACEVQPVGSLGLLALGFRGVMAWRAARATSAQELGYEAAKPAPATTLATYEAP